MANLQVSKEEMLGRVARFKQLRPSEQAFVDSKIPGHERLIYNVIGKGVTEDPALKPAITDARDFNLTYVKAEPGKGAAFTAIQPSRCSRRYPDDGQSSGAITAKTN